MCLRVSCFPAHYLLTDWVTGECVAQKDRGRTLQTNEPHFTDQKGFGWLDNTPLWGCQTNPVECVNKAEVWCQHCVPIMSQPPHSPLTVHWWIWGHHCEPWGCIVDESVTEFYGLFRSDKSLLACSTLRFTQVEWVEERRRLIKQTHTTGTGLSLSGNTTPSSLKCVRPNLRNLMTR